MQRIKYSYLARRVFFFYIQSNLCATSITMHAETPWERKFAENSEDLLLVIINYEN